MSATEIIRAAEALPPTEKLEVMRHWVAEFADDPKQRSTVERLLRRLENPDIPEDVWQGFEECEDSKGIEMSDEHFRTPPV